MRNAQCDITPSFCKNQSVNVYIKNQGPTFYKNDGILWRQKKQRLGVVVQCALQPQQLSSKHTLGALDALERHTRTVSLVNTIHNRKNGTKLHYSVVTNRYILCYRDMLHFDIYLLPSTFCTGMFCKLSDVKNIQFSMKPTFSKNRAVLFFSINEAYFSLQNDSLI